MRVCCRSLAGAAGCPCFHRLHPPPQSRPSIFELRALLLCSAFRGRGVADGWDNGRLGPSSGWSQVGHYSEAGASGGGDSFGVRSVDMHGRSGLRVNISFFPQTSPPLRRFLAWLYPGEPTSAYSKRFYFVAGPPPPPPPLCHTAVVVDTTVPSALTRLTAGQHPLQRHQVDGTTRFTCHQPVLVMVRVSMATAACSRSRTSTCRGTI